MKEKLVNFLIIEPLFVLLYFFRTIFLTGKIGKVMHNLFYFSLSKVIITQPEHGRKFKLLIYSIKDHKNIFNQRIEKVYKAKRIYLKHILKNFIARRLIFGSIKRHFLKWRGYTIPSLLAISLNAPGKGCNLSCSLCYANTHPDIEMPFGLLKKIIEEQEHLGIYCISVLGGEPFLYEKIYDMLESYPHTTFWVNTNGMMLKYENIKKIASLGNTCLFFPLEGFKEETDSLRGKGFFGKITALMQYCKSEQVIYSVNVTLTRENFDIATSNEFFEFLVSLNCFGLTYSYYIALGKNTMPNLELTDKQSNFLESSIAYLRNTYPLFISVGRNGKNVNGCFAANQYIHFLPDGKAEPCPFTHWASKNIKTHSILEITNSPFFAGIRQLNNLGIHGLVPCQSNKILTIRKLFTELGATPTTT